MYDLITITLAILGLSTIVGIHEYGHYKSARLFRMPIKAFSIGFGSGLSWSRGGIDYRLGSIPLGGYVSFLSRDDMADRGMPDDTKTFSEFPLWQKLVVFAAGPAINIVFGIILLFALMPSEMTSLAPVISDVKESSFAQNAGIQPGDRVISVAGHSIDTRDAVLKHINLNLLDHDIQFVFESATSGMNYTVSAPSSLWREGEGIGVFFVSTKEAEADPSLIYHQEFSTLDKAFLSVDYAKTIIGAIAKTLIQLPTNGYAREQLGSVIMLGAEGSKAAQRDWTEYFFFLASVNLMIAFVNLLPFPFTDGSQIVLSTLQGVFKKPVPKAVESTYYYLGAAAFASIFVLGITNDIARYFMQ